MRYRSRTSTSPDMYSDRLHQSELNLPFKRVSGGSPSASDVLSPSSFCFNAALCVLRGVCGVLSSSESERVMQGLETEREAEGEGDAGGVRAAGKMKGKKKQKQNESIRKEKNNNNNNSSTTDF